MESIAENPSDLMGYCPEEEEWKPFTADKEQRNKGSFRCECGALFSQKIGEQVTSARTFNLKGIRQKR